MQRLHTLVDITAQASYVACKQIMTHMSIKFLNSKIENRLSTGRSKRGERKRKD